MRVTKKKLTKKESKQITELVDTSVVVDDFTISVDFAKDTYALFKEKLSKRKQFKSFWELFKDIKKLYTRFQFGNLMKNVEFYSHTKNFLKYFILSALFRELDKLDPMEALKRFLLMFKPPPPPPPPQPQGSQGQDEDKKDDKQKEEQQQQGKGSGQGQPQKQQQNGNGQGQSQQKGKSPSGKSKDKQGLSSDLNSLPIDMTKFKQNLPKIEKAINSGLLDKDDFQKYFAKSAGIAENEVRIENIVNLIPKIAQDLTNKELNIFYIARKKELTERYRRDEVRKSVPYPDDEMSIKNIDKYQELLKTIPTQFALDDDIFNQKLLKKELLIRDYQSRRLKRQALYLLIDVSSSMDGAKNIYASGVALAFVRQAISEGSVYFLRFFDHGIKQLHKITNEKDAAKMADILIRQPYSGGGTDIDNALRTAISDIKNAPEQFEKAEIMVISDGEDDVSLTKDQLRKIKIHSTIIDGHNQDLKNLSDTYIELKSSDIEINE
jgi:uncharacterized protein with von Willebrand factor type A (vWA) domain